MVAVGDDGLTVSAYLSWRDLDHPPALAVLDEDIIAVEAQYVGPGAHASLRLAEWTGALLASLPPGCRILRPLATTWRARVLRRARMGRKEAKRAAIAACVAHSSGLPAGVSALPDVAEAWCMARYAWGAERAGVASW